MTDRMHNFDELPLFRSTDKETSRIGAAEILGKLTGLRAEFVRRVRDWHHVTGLWPTALEAAGGNESLRKRAAECVKSGALVEGESRRCGVTGRLATTYVVRQSTK